MGVPRKLGGNPLWEHLGTEARIHCGCGRFWMNERKSVSVRRGNGAGAFKALSLISVINFMERDFWREEEDGQFDEEEEE